MTWMTQVFKVKPDISSSQEYVGREVFEGFHGEQEATTWN